MKKKDKRVELEWEIQPKQVEFLRACGLSFIVEGGRPEKPKARVICYGGSAGSGKSHALLMLGLTANVAFPGCKVGYFRREYPQLEGPGGAIMGSHELYQDIASWNGSKRRWTFPKQGIVQFAHCKNEEDVYSYNSQQFDILLIDESTQFTEFQLGYLMSRNRATVPGVTPFMAMATNPGGVSHGYHKKNFVEAGVPGEVLTIEVQPGTFRKHIFIPARLEDNQVLEERDPGYRSTLEGMPYELRKALLEGDWNVFSGQYFKTFSVNKHVVEPFTIPEHWRRFASIDWGYAAPCAVLWHTIDPTMGRVYTYRELYVTEHRAAEVAELFLQLSEGEQIAYVKSSPDMWHERGLGSKASPGEIIAEEFTSRGINLEAADNRRILGWQRVREYLADSPDSEPWWQVFNNCVNLIRTLPEQVHDRNKVEDVSGEGEDHGPESLRYGLMSRPSPNEGSSFMSGAREHFGTYDEDDDFEDDMEGETVTFYDL